MSSRFVNLALFVDFILLLASGILLLETGRPQDAWLYTFHRYTGAVLLVLLIPKARIIWRSLARQFAHGSWFNLHTFAALALAALLVVVLFFALAWTLNWLPFYVNVILSVTPLGLHWYLAFALIPFFAWHAYKRWPLVRRHAAPTTPPPLVPSMSRRTLLRLLAVGAAGAVGLGALEQLAAATGWMRRFTGSRFISNGNAADFPITNSDVPPTIDLAVWRLRLSGRVQSPLELAYAELLALAPVRQTATVDCTLGWASTQEWQGVPLAALLARAGIPDDVREVTCRAMTGYVVVLSMAEVNEALLATHVGGIELAPAHGFPARLVVPSQRGFRWVKWVGEFIVA